MVKGKLSHDEKITKDVDAGFATVEESSVGKKDINRVWSDDDLIAQAILFFIAGFETVSSTMSFLLHELAMNPEVQERLVEEIRRNEAKNGGRFDYNSVQNMVYMDMIRKGTGIGIPVWAFHRDPQYFPDPLKFDPERFSDENKHNINPFSYMPFGMGPRNCIAILFFIAGFETVSSTMSFLLHELAMNPEVQERLVEEIRRNEAKNGG
ncbi:Cytochrome 9A20, partial [Operophtera brumata]